MWEEIGGEQNHFEGIELTIAGNQMIYQSAIRSSADRRGIYKHGLKSGGRNGLNDSARNGRQGQALVEPITHFCMEYGVQIAVLFGFLFLPQRDWGPWMVIIIKRELMRASQWYKMSTRAGKKLGDWIKSGE